MKEQGISSTVCTERDQYYEQEEYEDEDEEEKFELQIDCDEAYEVLQEVKVDDTPKIANYNEKFMLLNALCEFQATAGEWYWNILEKENNKDYITDLLADCGSMKIQESQYLTKLVGSRRQV